MCCNTYRSKTLAAAIYNTVGTFAGWGLIFWLYNPWDGLQYKDETSGVDLVFILLLVFSMIQACLTVVLWYGWVKRHFGFLKTWGWINVLLIIMEIVGMILSQNPRGVLGTILRIVCIFVVLRYSKELEMEKAPTVVEMERGVTRY